MDKVCNVKFIYSEKVTNFHEIPTVDLSYLVTVKSTLKILQNFVAFSDYIYELICGSVICDISNGQFQESLDKFRPIWKINYTQV